MPLRIMTDDTYDSSSYIDSDFVYFILTEDLTARAMPPTMFITNVDQIKEKLLTFDENDIIEIYFSDNPTMKILQANFMKHMSNPIDYMVDGEYMVEIDVKSLLMSFESFIPPEKYNDFSFTIIDY